MVPTIEVMEKFSNEEMGILEIVKESWHFLQIHLRKAI